MRNHSYLLMCSVLVAVFALPARATDLSWEYQVIDPYGSPSLSVSLAMRTGAVWPTVFHEGTNQHNGQLVASSLLPVGWVPQDLGVLYGAYEGGLPRAKPGHDGRVGVVWQTPQGDWFAQSSPNGWQFNSLPMIGPYAPESAPGFDYLSNDTPVVARSAPDGMYVSAYNGWSWETDQVTDFFGNPVYGQRVSTAVTSQDEIGVAYVGNGLSFAFKSPLSGDWATVEVNQQIYPEYVSLAFGPNDETAIASIENDSLFVSRFDPVSGSWATELLTEFMSSRRVNLVFNSLGQAALAYVEEDEVHYRINDGGGWLDYILDPDPEIEVHPRDMSDAALAFDAEDLPVISYHAYDGLLLAYDPVVVPEPASIVLMLGAAALIRRRR